MVNDFIVSDGSLVVRIPVIDALERRLLKESMERTADAGRKDILMEGLIKDDEEIIEFHASVAGFNVTIFLLPSMSSVAIIIDGSLIDYFKVSPGEIKATHVLLGRLVNTIIKVTIPSFTGNIVKSSLETVDQETTPGDVLLLVPATMESESSKLMELIAQRKVQMVHKGTTFESTGVIPVIIPFSSLNQLQALASFITAEKMANIIMKFNRESFNLDCT